VARIAAIDAAIVAEWLFGTLLEGTPAAYADYASDYFERDIAIDPVA
jgi:hypothetical protein